MSESPAMQDDFLDSLMGDFLDESTGLLAQLNEKLLALDGWAKNEASEASGPPIDMLNEMFRAAHSLKGLSGMLRLTEINTLTHKVENIFDAARNSVLPVTNECVDVIFPAIDCISAMIDALRGVDAEGVDAQPVLESIDLLLSKNNAVVAIGNQKEIEKQLAEITSAAKVLEESEPSSTCTPHLDPLDGLVDDTDIPPRYLSIFLDESTLVLDELTECVIGGETASFETILGICHRLKGSAASIGLHRIAKLAHLMEDYLQDARRLATTLPAEGSDSLLECVDALRHYCAAMKEGSPVSDKLGAAAAKVSALRSTQATLQQAFKAQTENPQAETSPNRQREIARCRTALPPDSQGVIGYARFEAGLPLADCKAKILFNKLDQLGTLFHRWTSDETIDLNGASLEVVFGVVTDLTPEQIQSLSLLEGIVELDCQGFQTALELSSDADKPLTSQAQPSAKLPTVEASKPTETKAAEGKAAGDNKAKPTETLRVDIERLDQLMNLAGQLVINRARFGQISEGLKSLSSFRSITHSLSNAQHNAARIAQSLADDKVGGDVSTETLGELAAKMRADLEMIQRDMAQFTKIRSAIASLADAVHQLDRVADGIQSTVMDTRMVPIGPLFTRFKRVIRDLIRGNEKDIRLEIVGENTELDKRMIDELSDPLIHLVRNSVDHGIESAQARLSAGKPAQGVVKLNAFHRGNRIVIEVVDDGKGLDLERILNKALSKGIISEAEAEGMTPQQIMALIWRPGFSTAEQVTEVSGRGMGMDIVMSKIESLNGVVDVQSEKGKGCTFSIKLPLTMAILPSLLSVIDGEVYAIPVESVTEIVRVKGSDLTSVQGKSVLRVRGRVISIIELDEVFEGVRGPNFNETLAQRESITMVIIGADSREIAIVVDHLIGEQDVVIQSLAENFQNVEGVAGASILGDGRISLILDVPALLEKSSRLARSAIQGHAEFKLEAVS